MGQEQVPLRFGFGMGRELPITEIAEHTQVADSIGSDHVTFIDSQALSRDSVAMMTIAALNSSQVRIGQGVTQPYTRHPTVLANSVATIDELSGGRAFLGIGAGGSATGVLGLEPRPIKDLAETVRFFREFVRGEPSTYSDAFTARSEWARRPIPVIIGTDGPKSMRMCCELADEVFVPGLSPEIIKWRQEALAPGFDRDPNFKIWVRTMVCVDDDLDYAREQVKSYGATCAFQFWFATLRWDTEDAQRMRDELPGRVVEAVDKLGREYDWYEHERRGAIHAAELDDDVLENWVMYGPAPRIIEQIRQMRELGVDGLSMTLYTIKDKKVAMQRFADEVLPHVT